jgi:hypothetical protein
MATTSRTQNNSQSRVLIFLCKSLNTLVGIAFPMGSTRSINRQHLAHFVGFRWSEPHIVKMGLTFVCTVTAVQFFLIVEIAGDPPVRQLVNPKSRNLNRDISAAIGAYPH